MVRIVYHVEAALYQMGHQQHVHAIRQTDLREYGRHLLPVPMKTGV